MTVMQMEQCKNIDFPGDRYRYFVQRLIEIGCKTKIPLDISRFSVDAIQAGIVTEPGHVSKAIAMPLGEIPVNRHRGWSIDSLDSTEDCIVFPGSGSTRPSRQPHNAPSEARAQSDDGFARFLKQHSSPTHQRVTAGGRIVPMEPIPAPPQFNLLIDNLARGKDSLTYQRIGDGQEIGNKRSVPVANTAASVKADDPSAGSKHSRQTSTACQEPLQGAIQDSQVNINSGDFVNGNFMPSPLDLPHLSSANSTGPPQTFTNFSSLFNLNPQALTQNQWATLAPPLSGMVFNPHTNMLTPIGEQPSMMPTSMVQNPPFSAVTGGNEMNPPVTRGKEFERFDQKGHAKDFSTNCNQLVPISSAANMQPQYPSSLMVNDGMTSIASTQGVLTPQIGTHLLTGYSSQVSATDMQLNSMMMNQSLAQPSSMMARKITEEDVAAAGAEFRQLDSQLQGHDQFTARHHSGFDRQTKSYYAKERMALVEQRDMVRRKFNQLRSALDEENSTRCKLPEPNNQHQAWSTQAMTTFSTHKNSNTNLNVQAAAWVPEHVGKSSGVRKRPQPLVSIEAHPRMVNNSAAGPYKTASEHASFAQQVSMQVLNPRSKPQTMRSITASVSPSAPPGPYTRQLSNPDSELSEYEVDEWGARRGCAPPLLAQKQSEEEMKLLSQQRARIMSAPASLLPNVGQTSLDDESPSYPVDEWGSRVGRAPPELAKHQNEQGAKLAKMNPYQRSQMSLATLDSLPPAKVNVGKTVTFADNNANTTFRCGYESEDGKSSVASSDEPGWRPMKAGIAPFPNQADWEAIVEGSNKEKGVKTEVFLVTGSSIVVEGQRVPACKTDEGTEKSDAGGTYQPSISEEEQASMTNQLMSIERGIRGLEAAPGNQGFPAFNPWSYQDENNMFRNKGPSSVALQSVTARGMLPGLDAEIDRLDRMSLRPTSKTDHKGERSVSKSGSPPLRSLRDIWGVPSMEARTKAATQEEDMSKVQGVMYKY